MLRKGMIGARDEGALAVKEFGIAEPCAEISGVIRQRKVEFFLLDHLQGAHAAGLDDLEFDLRMCTAKLAQNMRQKDDAELEGHRNAHLRMAVRHIANLIVKARDLHEDGGYLAEELRPVRRNGDLAPFAVEEIQPRLRLERLHGDGHRRLRDVEVLRRLRDVLPLTDLIEIPHLNQRHPIISPPHTGRLPSNQYFLYCSLVYYI